MIISAVQQSASIVYMYTYTYIYIYIYIPQIFSVTSETGTDQDARTESGIKQRSLFSWSLYIHGVRPTNIVNE